MSDPTVSVIVPAYNVEGYIAATLSSVLNQTYPASEIIVVDDGSTDRTGEVVRRFPRVQLVVQPNTGPAEARNVGIRLSTGKLIAFLDADDVWRPEKLERQIEMLLDEPDLDGSFTLLRHFVNEGSSLPASLRPHLLEVDAVGHTPSTFMVRRSSFQRVGWFSSEHLADDADWFFRAKDAGLTFGVVDESLVLKRVRDGAISENPQDLLRGVLSAARDSVARQRDLVSVMIAAYNGGAYLDAALRSVGSQNVVVEVIVVDDGSTDDTREVVSRHAGVKYIFEENRGTAAALNRALDHARGRFFAFLDQDDLWTQDKLNRQLVVLRKNPEVDMVQGRLRQFVSPEIVGEERHFFVGAGRVEPAPLPGTTLIRRPAFWRVGHFDSHLTVGYFADWMFRSQEAGLNAVMLDDVLLERRLHRRNQTSNKGSRIEYARVIKAALDRRRDRN